MKKPIRLIPIGILLVLIVPVFRYLCEKFRTCEIMQSYTIIAESDLLFEGLA